MKNKLLKSYIKNIKRFPLLSKSVEKRLISQRDKKCEHILVESNLKLVIKIATKYNKVWPDFDIMDLIQEGNIGLMSGVNQYDPTKGIRLSTYVYYRIEAHIYDYIRLKTTPIKITNTKVHQKIFDNLSKEKKRLEEKGIIFNHELIAENLDVPVQEVVELDPLLSPGGVGNIDIVNEQILLDNRYNPEEQLIKHEHLKIVSTLIDEFRETLRPIQQYIFDNRIIAEQPKTLQYISEITTTSKQNIQQMEQVIRVKIRTYFNPDEIKELFNGN